MREKISYLNIEGFSTFSENFSYYNVENNALKLGNL
jgi:hypothetical protein